MMIGVASKEYVPSQGTVTISLPATVKGIVNVLYGNVGWSVSADGRTVGKSGLEGLEVGLLVADLA